jgi:hypothetical protein
LQDQPIEQKLAKWVKEEQIRASIGLVSSLVFYAGLPGLVLLGHFEPWKVWGLKLLCIAAGLLFWSFGTRLRREVSIARKIVELSRRINAEAPDSELHGLGEALLARVLATWPKGLTLTASHLQIQLLEHGLSRRPVLGNHLTQVIQYLTGRTAPKEMGLGSLAFPACLLIATFGLPWMHVRLIRTQELGESMECTVRKWEEKRECIELNLAKLERELANPQVPAPFGAFKAIVDFSACRELLLSPEPLREQPVLSGSESNSREKELTRRLQQVWPESWVAATRARMDRIPGLRAFLEWDSGRKEWEARWSPVLSQIRDARKGQDLKLLGDDELPPPTERVMFGALSGHPGVSLHLDSAPWRNYPDGPDSSFTFVLVSDVISRKSDLICVVGNVSYKVEYTDLEVVIGTWQPFRLLGKRLLSPPPRRQVQVGEECSGGFRVAPVPDPKAYTDLVQRHVLGGAASPQVTDSSAVKSADRHRKDLRLQSRAPR